jgi:hypothetical protein
MKIGALTAMFWVWSAIFGVLAVTGQNAVQLLLAVLYLGCSIAVYRKGI